MCGIPASGKSTFTELILKHTNDLLEISYPSGESGPRAIVVGLDGWHLTRAQLDALPDPKLAHDRRGIHWTFDGRSYVDFCCTLREDLTSTTPVITAPSFDHALKDPTENAVSIYP